MNSRFADRRPGTNGRRGRGNGPRGRRDRHDGAVPRKPAPGGVADLDADWRSARPGPGPQEPDGADPGAAEAGEGAPADDSPLVRLLQELLARLRQFHTRGLNEAAAAAAFDEARAGLARVGAGAGPGVAGAAWSQVLVECAKVAPRQESLFLRMAQFVSEVQSALRARIASHAFHDLTDVLCRGPGAHRPPLVSALAALVLGNVAEVPARVARLMQVFEAALASGPEAGEAGRLTALQGMANICYIEEGVQINPSNDFLRAVWMPRLIAHFLKHSALAYNQLAAGGADSQARLFQYRVLKACLVGLSFLLCRQPKLDVNCVRALLMQISPFCAIGLTRMVPLNEHLTSSSGGILMQGQETATGRSPGSPLLPLVKSKPGGGRRQAGNCGGRVEFRHGPEALESRLRTLRMSGDADLDALLPSSSPEWDALVSEAESSESESETAGEASPRPPPSPERSVANKVRHLALTCLKRLLAITLRRVVHSFWLDFLPSGAPVSWPAREGRDPALARPPPDLLTLLLKESLGKNRILLLDSVQLFFDGSRQYLAAAEDVCEPTTAFTPYSSRLAASIREIHRRLVVALLAEREVGVQVHLLKCLALLVSGVPYHKLKPGLVTKVFRVARTYMDQADSTADLRTGCLGVIGAILACDGPLFEVCHALSQAPAHFPALQERDRRESGGESFPATPQLALSGLQTPAGPGSVGAATAAGGALFSDGCCHFGSCWLVSQCLQYAHPDCLSWEDAQGAAGQRERPRQSAPVRVQALATLRQMLGHYLRFLRPSLDPLKHTLRLCLAEAGDGDQMMLRTQAIKLLTSLLPAMRETDRDEWLRLWKEFTDQLVAGLQCETHYSVRSWSAQCLALADEAVFASVLPRRTVLACLAIMLGRAGDPDVEPDGHVRGNAIRALGHWVTVPCLYSDAAFVSDVVSRAMALCSAPEDAHLVRSHAAWCLANAVEVLVAHKERCLGDGTAADAANSAAVLREFGVWRYKELLGCAVALCSGTVKHRENGARTLGYLFRLVPGRLAAHPDVAPVMRAGAAVLADCMRLQESNGAAKIRWNACYAAGNLFRNAALPLDSAEWARGVFLALRDALVGDKYFKVRNYACLSLLLIDSRAKFDAGGLGPGEAGEGDEEAAPVFVLVTRAVVETLASIAQGDAAGVAFSEAHHRSYLMYLCCLLAMRLLAMASANDLDRLGDQLLAAAATGEGLWMALPQVWSHLRVFQSHFAKDSLIPRWVISYDVVHTSPEEVRESLHRLRVHLFGLASEGPVVGQCLAALCDLVDRVAAAEYESAVPGAGATAFRQTYD